MKIIYYIYTLRHYNLDETLVAARAIAPEMLVQNGVRKRPLRAVAGQYMSASIAQYEKKAMQYGSGVMKEIQRLAARKGYKRSLQDYLQRNLQERRPRNRSPLLVFSPNQF